MSKTHVVNIALTNITFTIKSLFHCILQLGTWNDWNVFSCVEEEEKWNYFCGRALRGHYQGRIVWAGTTLIWNILENIEMSFMQILAQTTHPRPTHCLQSLCSELEPFYFFPPLFFLFSKWKPPVFHFHFKAKSVAGGTWWSPDRKEDTKWC